MVINGLQWAITNRPSIFISGRGRCGMYNMERRFLIAELQHTEMQAITQGRLKIVPPYLFAGECVAALVDGEVREGNFIELGY